MDISELTAREARAMRPDREMLSAAIDYLIKLGWRFKLDQHATHKPPYSWGWWCHPDHPIKYRPVGDPGNFYYKAWDTLRAYVAKERHAEIR